jgi:50S ribosomal protein L16 3-hydroxylase
MRAYWHKRPLLVRQAIPAFALAKQAGQALVSPIAAETLFGFACDGLSEARLVHAKPWTLDHGPFQKKQIPALAKRDWTLLVQGVEARHPSASAVLSWFRFIPDARLDDLMISIAGVGGGVGPHVDSYDVFLIQMEGRRRWKISSQTDLDLRDDLPLKILSRFKPENDWILEPGDLLYLPPHIAHEGVALDPGCQTWSVGFRSPTFKELIAEGLWRLAESLENDPQLRMLYADPHQTAVNDPAVLPEQLEQEIMKRLAALKLGQNSALMDGITAYLSEPKPQAIFDAPTRPLSPSAFWKALDSKALIPHPQTRLLVRGTTVYCNGEAVSLRQDLNIAAIWRALAKMHSFALGRSRKSSGNNDLKHYRFDGDNSLYEAYCSGWLLLQ